MALAPLSLVQAVISGGLVFLTVLADRFFGCNVGPRQWAGVALTAVGLSLIAVTLPAHAGASSGYSVAGMIAFEIGLLGVGAFLVFSPGWVSTIPTTARCSASPPAACSASPTWPSRP